MARVLKIIKQGDLYKVLLCDDNKGVQFCNYMSLSKERVLAYCFGFSEASERFVNIIDKSDESISNNAVDDLPY